VFRDKKMAVAGGGPATATSICDPLDTVAD